MESNFLVASLLFFNETAPTEIYTLSLHDALPIWGLEWIGAGCWRSPWTPSHRTPGSHARHSPRKRRSEEHTSELQSPYDLVCRLLLEKKKTITENRLTRSRQRRQTRSHTLVHTFT